MARSLNKASTLADAKLENEILTAFTVVALERPFDDYETVCGLQNINGADLGETFNKKCLYRISVLGYEECDSREVKREQFSFSDGRWWN